MIQGKSGGKAAMVAAIYVIGTCGTFVLGFGAGYSLGKEKAQVACQQSQDSIQDAMQRGARICTWPAIMGCTLEEMEMAVDYAQALKKLDPPEDRKRLDTLYRALRCKEGDR